MELVLLIFREKIVLLYMYFLRILVGSLLLAILLTAVAPLSVAQGGEDDPYEEGESTESVDESDEALTEEEHLAQDKRRYDTLLVSLHKIPYQESVALFEQVTGSTLTVEDQGLMTSTLEQMRSRGHSYKSIYRAYFQSVADAMQSTYVDSASFTHLLEMLHSSASSYSTREYRRLLQFLLGFLGDGTLYASPHQTWMLEAGGHFDFGFEAAAQPVFQTKGGAPPLLAQSIEGAANTDSPITEGTSSSDADFSPSATDQNTAKGEENWANDSEPASADDWGEEDDDWGEEDNDSGEGGTTSDPINDWDVTDPANVQKWGKAKDPYHQTATKFTAEQLYGQIGISINPLPPFSGGAILSLDNVGLLCTTPMDSITMSDVQAKFSILGKQLESSSAQMPWPVQAQSLRDATIRFEKMNMHFSLARIQAETSYLKVPAYVSDEIEGIFECFMKGGKRFYPMFRSSASDLSFDLPYEGVKYQGGLTLRDSLLYGEAAASKPGYLQIGSDSSAYVLARSPRFLFSDRIYSKGAAISLYHLSDSLCHPQLELKYNPEERHLFMQRKPPYLRAPFFSSYLGMYMQTDVLDWDMNVDSLSMYIMRAQKNVAAFFESEAYFSEERYSNIRSFFPFHPLLAVVRFAKEADTNTFLASDVSSAYKINFKQLEASLQFLHEQQYIAYDKSIGVVDVHEKAFHWAFSALGYRDYDRLLISSRVDGGVNASFNLTQGEMSIRGVDQIYFTPDFKVYAQPDGGIVRLKKGKDFTFDGDLSSGTIFYSGKDFDFDYEGFRIIMNQIDSMSLQVEEPADSLSNPTGESRKQEVVNGVLNETEGVFLISAPSNRSGQKNIPSYPRFDSKNDSDVYFDDPRVLGGVYDHSVRFIAPPFEVDSINSLDFTVVGLQGTFHAGPIMPPIRQKLSIMSDRSLGFTHQIEDPVGYPLYGVGDSYIHGEMKMDLGGLQTNGRIEHQTTTLDSDKFTLYMDKVVAEVREGHVRPGNLSGGSTSYPKVDFEHAKLFWLPEKDNMLLKTKGVPMNVYDSIADFEGTLNIKKTGAYASGKLKMHTLEAVSDYFQFKEKEFQGRQLNLEVKSSNSEQPDIRATRIEFRYDLEEQKGYMKPEKAGMPSIDFPYIQMKTSLYSAVWDYKARNVQMERPDYIPLSKSFFTSTKPEMDELTFQANQATYSLDSGQLRAEGVPFIRVLGVDIVPHNNRVFVREGSDVGQLTDAILYIDSESKMHTLVNGDIKIHSRNRFTGTAEYLYTNADADTFYISFDEFLLEEAQGDDGKKREVVVAEGLVPEEQRFKASAGFYFKGKVKMMAHRRFLILDGFVKLILEGEERHIHWISYTTEEKDEEIVIDYDRTKTEDGLPLSAGLHYDQSGKLYLTFMQNKRDAKDIDLFEPEGMLRYDSKRNFYVIQQSNQDKKSSKDQKRTDQEGKDPLIEEEEEETEEEEASRYVPKTFMYSPRTENILLDGNVHLFGEDKHLDMQFGARGKANLEQKIYELDGILTLDADLPKKVTTLLSEHIDALRNYVDLKVAQQPADFLSSLSFLIGQRATTKYAEDTKKPLFKASSRLHHDLVFSLVSLQWDPNRKNWHNKGKLHLSHIQKRDMRVQSTGYLQIKPEQKSANLDLLLYFSPTVWYYLRYHDQNLSLYSGVVEFNELVTQQSKGKAPVPGSYSFTIGNSTQTSQFVEDFSSHYTEGGAPDLTYPSPVSLESLPTEVPTGFIEEEIGLDSEELSTTPLRRRASIR